MQISQNGAHITKKIIKQGLHWTILDHWRLQPNDQYTTPFYKRFFILYFVFCTSHLTTGITQSIYNVTKIPYIRIGISVYHYQQLITWKNGISERQTMKTHNNVILFPIKLSNLILRSLQEWVQRSTHI